MWLINKRYNLCYGGIIGGMVDTHSHLLWGVDDGSPSQLRTSDMIHALQSIGVNSAFVTPHIMAGLPQNDTWNLRRMFDDTLRPLADRLNFEIRLAGEYMLDEAFLPKIKNKEELLTYDGRHLLFEMSHLGAPVAFDEMLFEMSDNGYIPVLAHVERYGFLKMSDCERLKDRGCKFQLNLGSVAQAYGKHVKNRALALLDSDMCDFVGTDIHSTNIVNLIKKQTVSSKIHDKIAQLVDNNRQLVV